MSEAIEIRANGQRALEGLEAQLGSTAAALTVDRDDGVSLPLRFGLGPERQIPLQRGQTIVVVLEIIARERGCAIEELIIVREGAPEPIEPCEVVDEHYPHHRRHHVHYRADVQVQVFYGAGTKHHAFQRHTAVEKVLEWALQAFAIDLNLAPEFELAVHRTGHEVLGSEHVGHLAGHHHTLAFDLVRGAVVNGAV